MKKIVAVLLCLVTVLTSFCCACSTPEMPPEEEKNVSYKDIYADVISLYKSYLTVKKGGDALTSVVLESSDESFNEIALSLRKIVDFVKSPENLGYGYKDLDGNGVPELLIMSSSSAVFAILTISENKPILLASTNGSPYSYIMFSKTNRFFITHLNNSEEANISYVYTCRVDGEKLIYDAAFGAILNRETKETRRFQIINGKEVTIDEDTYQDLNYEYAALRDTTGNSQKPFAPYIYLPLAEKVEIESLPVADFSSYSKIIETCRTVFTSIEKITYSSLSSGEYDNLFSFPKDVYFEYYIKLLYAACNNSRMGYCESDINGDSKNELLLLGENYNILSIFTEKNGEAVMLDTFFYVGNVFLDIEKGLIRVCKFNPNFTEVELLVYNFSKGGEYKLLDSVIIASNGKYYQTKDGKTSSVTLEDIRAFRTTYQFSDNYYSEEDFERIRNEGVLNFIPFDNDSSELLKTSTKLKWARLEKFDTYPSEYATTYITFENVSDTSAKICFKYVHTTHTPDPEKENYYISNHEESFVEATGQIVDGVMHFEAKDFKGKIEFGKSLIWLIIEESSDSRFPEGHHICSKSESFID